MASNYTGDPGAIFLTVSLLDDGDKRNVSSLRPPLERCIDNAANLDARTGVVEGDYLSQTTGGPLSGTITVHTGGALSLADSGTSLAVHSGAAVNVASGGVISLASGGEVTVADGAEILISAQTGSAGLVAVHSSDVRLQSETCNWRSPMVPQWVSLRASVGVVGTPAWQDNDETGTGGCTWYQNETASLKIIRFPLNRLPGDIITQIQATLIGGAGAGHGGSLPASMPRIKLVKFASGGRTVIADAVDASASAAAYDAAHLVTLNDTTDTLGTHLMPFTVTGEPLYIEIHGEHGANAVDATLRLFSLFGASVSSHFRGAVEFA